MFNSKLAGEARKDVVKEFDIIQLLYPANFIRSLNVDVNNTVSSKRAWDTQVHPLA